MATAEEKRQEEIRKAQAAHHASRAAAFLPPDPRFTAGPNAVDAVAAARTKSDKLRDQIALKQKEILEAKIEAKQGAITRRQQSNALEDATNFTPLEYQRPVGAALTGGSGGVLGLTADDRASLQGRLPSTAPTFGIETPDKYSMAEAASAAGIDATTGLRPGIRSAVELLSYDGALQQRALESEVRSDLGDDFPEHEAVLKRDNASGMPAYLRKLEDGSFRWTLVNSPGTDVADILAGSTALPGLGMEVVGEVVGAIGGSAISPGPGTVAGAVVGSAVGGWLSIPLRAWLAKRAGIPDSVFEGVDTTSEANFHALLAGGGSLLGHTVIGATTTLRNFFFRGLDVDDIPALEREIFKRQKIIDKTNEATGVKIQASLGQLTGNSELQVAEATLKGISLGPTAKKLNVADIDNLKASSEAMRSMATQEVRAPGAQGFRSVEEISEELEERLIQKRLDIPKHSGAKAQEEVLLFDEAYASASDPEKLIRLQQHSAAQFNEVRRLQDEAWDLHRQVIEWDKQTRLSNIVLDNTGNTPIRQFMSTLRGDADGALMTTLAEANEKTLRVSGYGPKEVKAAMEGGDPTGLAGAVLDTRHLHTTLSHLKRIRKQLDDVNNLGMEKHDVNGLIQAIEEQMKVGTFRRRSSGRAVHPARATQIREAWLNANKQTETYHAMFDSKSMRALLKVNRVVQPNGRIETQFDLPPGFIRNQLFKPEDARFLSESLNAVGQDPVVKAGLANELMKIIRTDTIKKGRVQGGLYNDAMSNYQDHMAMLFSPDEMSKITNLGSLGRVVDSAENVAQQLSVRLERHYGRRIASPTSPFNIADEILSDRMSAKQVRNIMTDVRTMDPKLAQQVEEKVMQRLYDVTSKADKKVTGFKRLDDMLIAKRDTLEAVGGKQFVKDLDGLRDTLNILAESRFSKKAREEIQGMWMRATRLIFGPLGREQRFISAIGRMARTTRGNAVSELLRTPGVLRKFVKLKNLKVTDPRFWVGANLIGGDILDVFRSLEGGEENYQKFMRGELDDLTTLRAL